MSGLHHHFGQLTISSPPHSIQDHGMSQGFDREFHGKCHPLTSLFERESPPSRRRQLLDEDVPELDGVLVILQRDRAFGGDVFHACALDDLNAVQRHIHAVTT